MSNPSKLLVKIGLVLSLVIGVYFFITSEGTIFSTVSPNEKYKVFVTQERGGPLLVEKNVYLYAKRESKNVLEKQRLMSTDFMEGSFRDHYPRDAWLKPNILMIGNYVDNSNSKGKLKIKNEGEKTIRYLLIETSDDKFLIFDVEPKSQICLNFISTGMITVQTENKNCLSGKCIGKGIKIPDTNPEIPNNLEYQVIVDGRNIDISVVGYDVEPLGCCGFMRRDYDISSRPFWLDFFSQIVLGR